MQLAFLSPLEPERRVGRFLADTPHFAWAFEYLRHFPEHDVALVGGSVRDAVLGKVPAHHHLLVLTRDPVRTKAWLSQKPAPQDFDIKVRGRDELFADLEERDFAINAMGYSFRDGRIWDPYRGLEDLRMGKLRSVGDPARQLRKDPLLSLRALRMSARHNLRIAKDLWHAVQDHVPRIHALDTDHWGRAVYKVPRHRIAQETLLTLHHHSTFGWELFEKSGALPHVLPHSDDYEDEIQRTLAGIHDDKVRMRYAPAQKSGSLTAAGLSSAHPGGEKTYQEHAQRLQMEFISHPHMPFDHGEGAQLIARGRVIREENPQLWSLSRAEKVLGGDLGAQALALAHATSLALPREHEAMQHVERAAILRERIAPQAGTPKLIRGRDLLPLGISPGPHVRQLLNRIRDEQLKGNIRSHREAVDLARILLRPKFT